MPRARGGAERKVKKWIRLYSRSWIRKGAEGEGWVDVGTERGVSDGVSPVDQAFLVLGFEGFGRGKREGESRSIGPIYATKSDERC